MARLQADPALRSALRPLVDEITLHYLEIARSLAADYLQRPRHGCPPCSKPRRHWLPGPPAGHGGPVEYALESVKSLQGRSIEERGSGSSPERCGEFGREAIPPSAVKDRKLHGSLSLFPGSWLQTASTVANPFYGSAMLECGWSSRRSARRARNDQKLIELSSGTSCSSAPDGLSSSSARGRWSKSADAIPTSPTCKSFVSGVPGAAPAVVEDR